jgi:activating signal cointegrator complex subunit 1
VCTTHLFRPITHAGYRKSPGDSAQRATATNPIGSASGDGRHPHDAGAAIPDFIHPTTSGGFTATIEVPTLSIGKLIGTKGANLKKLEAETTTKVKIPKHGDVSRSVCVTGKEARGVESAYTRIEVLIESSVRSARPTHFLCIPLLGKDFDISLPAFQERATELGSGLAPEMFTESAAFHITLGVLKLVTQSAVNDAVALLDQCVPAAAKTALVGTRTIAVKGVGYMNDDPNAVDVLYGKVALDDGSDGLQRFVDAIASKFTAAGLLDVDHGRDGVKLHATLINSKKRRDVAGEERGRGGNHKRVAFNAVKILPAYSRHEFGAVALTEVHISRMAPRKGGFYIAEHVVKVP